MTRDVYVTAAGSYLPGPPIPNARMEEVLGLINGRRSAFGPMVLKQNRIESRHYALGSGGVVMDSNASMAAGAVRDALAHSELSERDIDFLATATTQGDLLVPGHAAQVHAELRLDPIEIASFQSVCASGVMALRAAYLNVKAGEKRAAAVVGSEFSSRWFRPGVYEPAIAKQGWKRAPLEAEFLRFTLSDGAGAVLLEPRPNSRGLSFRLEWVDLVSLASRFDVCMYAGATREKRFDLAQSWAHYETPSDAVADGAVMLLQDFELLKQIIRAWCQRYLQLVDNGRIDPKQVDHFLCHYSAHSLRVDIVEIMSKTGAMIPEEKWFTNLYTKGNTGSASIFVMLEEFIAKGLAKPGDRILCAVPESGRAMIGFFMLTAVAGEDVT